MEKVTRRNLLIGGLAVAGLGAAGIVTAKVLRDSPSGTAFTQDGGMDWDVIVIGAGSAGIAAARRLVDQRPELRVAIVEARDRIGGRMFTDRQSMGIPVERGCELVHGGPYAETYPWIERAGFDMRMLQNNYIRLAGASPDSPSGSWHAPDARASWLFPQGIPDSLIPFDPAGENLPLPKPRAGEMADAYLKRLGISAENTPSGLLYTLTDDSEPLYNTDAAEVGDVLIECVRYSLHPEDAPSPEVLNPEDPEHNDGDYKIIGGYDQLLTFMADDIPIFLETIVQEVAHSDKGVELLTSQGPMSARRAVFAVPAGVMQRRAIGFDRDLPSSKWAAFDEFKYNNIFKCLLEFDGKVFTPNGTDNWGYAESMDLFPTTIWNASVAQPSYDGQVFVGWETGDAARELLSLPLIERYEAVLENVRSAAGDHGLTYKSAVMTDWAEEPHSWGAYGHGGDADAMSETVDGVLYWAGMNTSTVSASYSSGIAQADELIKSL